MVRDPVKSEAPHRGVVAFLACAVLCNLVAVGAGIGAALAYAGEGRWAIAGAFRQHRALHVTFATAWIYLGGIAVLYHALVERQPAGLGRRMRVHLGSWLCAGLGMFACVCLGRYSGREYMEAPWHLSLPVLAGWLAMCSCYVSAFGTRLQGAPVYRYMWSMALVLFVGAFAEAHLWLLPGFGERPLRDIAVQWKAYGTLVGTFNLLVYGSVSYLACLRAGSDAPAHAPAAFALFLLGAANTFTNYGHHTFHIAQAPWVQWAGFLVSASELVIVAVLLVELARPVPDAQDDAALPVLRWGRFWSFVMIALAVLLSFPPLNTLAHGTHLVMAHAMGSMLGIDTLLLIAVHLELRRRWGLTGTPRTRRWVRWAVLLLNLGLAGVVASLSARGTADAVLRALGPLAGAPPAWLRHFPAVFVASGSLVAAALVVLDLEALAALWTALRARGRGPR